MFVEPKPYDELTFSRGTRKVRVKLKTALASNLGAARHGAAVAGLGLALLPSFVAGPDYAAGRIEPILLDWSLPALRMFAVYPHRRFLSPNVDLLAEALRAAFGDGTRDPCWPAAVSAEHSTRPRN